MTSSGWLMTLDERAPPLPSPGPDFLSSIPSTNRLPASAERGRISLPIRCRVAAGELPLIIHPTAAVGRR